MTALHGTTAITAAFTSYIMSLSAAFLDFNDWNAKTLPWECRSMFGFRLGESPIFPSVQLLLPPEMQAQELHDRLLKPREQLSCLSLKSRTSAMGDHPERMAVVSLAWRAADGDTFRLSRDVMPVHT